VPAYCKDLIHAALSIKKKLPNFQFGSTLCNVAASMKAKGDDIQNKLRSLEHLGRWEALHNPWMLVAAASTNRWLPALADRGLTTVDMATQLFALAEET
jgi:hypothetical protein